MQSCLAEHLYRCWCWERNTPPLSSAPVSLKHTSISIAFVFLKEQPNGSHSRHLVNDITHTHTLHLLLSRAWEWNTHTQDISNSQPVLSPPAIYCVSSSWHSVGVLQFQAKTAVQQLDANRSKITWHESLFNYLLKCLLACFFHWDRKSHGCGIFY